jgi:uncharacterized OB-fold protein
VSDKPFRVLPRVTKLNEHFWQGGADGKLHLLRCGSCRHYIHPPVPLCPECLSRDVSPEAVSGRARVATYTLNHQQWVPAPDHPYCIAIVELEEDASVRITTNVVNCPVEQVEIGMPVQVVFEQHDDVYLPLFEPVTS